MLLVLPLVMSDSYSSLLQRRLSSAVILYTVFRSTAIICRTRFTSDDNHLSNFDLFDILAFFLYVT